MIQKKKEYQSTKIKKEYTKKDKPKIKYKRKDKHRKIELCDKEWLQWR